VNAVGLVVNPLAAMDVRRLTSLGRTVNFHERVNVTARILAGLVGAGVREVRYMPEPTAIVQRAAEVLADTGDMPPPRLVPPPGQTTASNQAGTVAAAAELAQTGVVCVVTLGGDGTNRAVVTGWPDAVLVPVPGGTNNAFATPVEPVVAGYAAGLFARDPAALASAVQRRPLLRVDAPAWGGVALVDVVLSRHQWVGAHALWDPTVLVEAVVARIDPALVGLAGVAGAVYPLAAPDAAAVHLRFGGGGRTVRAVLGPGTIRRVDVRTWQTLDAGSTARLEAADRQTLALDGEREFVLAAGEAAEVTFEPAGPRVLDCATALRGPLG
jgi:hypothetical protein